MAIKTILLIIVISTINILGLFAQEKTDSLKKIIENEHIISSPIERKDVFMFVEEMPQFPGGQTEMMKYLSDNLRYPEDAAKQGIVGRVVIKFIVNKDGTVSDAQILRALYRSCDIEAARVVSSMPKWIPGKQNGKAVDVYFTIPIRFALIEDNNKEEKVISSSEKQ